MNQLWPLMSGAATAHWKDGRVIHVDYPPGSVPPPPYIPRVNRRRGQVAQRTARDIDRLTDAGYSVAAIAEMLSIAEFTVTHRQSRRTP